ncbi:MAG: hypothetical protein P4L46_26275 [Fimbriimonas sp.]|nr:hypothetical protein [Fimbriimonas sp.]
MVFLEDPIHEAREVIRSQEGLATVACLLVFLIVVSEIPNINSSPDAKPTKEGFLAPALS